MERATPWAFRRTGSSRRFRPGNTSDNKDAETAKARIRQEWRKDFPSRKLRAIAPSRSLDVFHSLRNGARGADDAPNRTRGGRTHPLHRSQFAHHSAAAAPAIRIAG